MAPIRRYLRISRYSVLEVRIYLDNPALAHSWLLNPRDPVLPRIIQAIRPLVLPKLREENERASGKGGGKGKRKAGVKDVVSEEDFEVSIFLTELSTQHALLTKKKVFRDEKDSGVKRTEGKLTRWLTGTTERPVVVDDDHEETDVVLREESDEEGHKRLDDFPEAKDGGQTEGRRGKRPRRDSERGLASDDDVSEDEGFRDQTTPLAKKPKTSGETNEQRADGEDGGDHKKKLELNTSYEGFSIYGRILCLVVKRRGSKGRIPGAPVNEVGQQMLESWVSTQAAQEQRLEDD